MIAFEASSLQAAEFGVVSTTNHVQRLSATTRAAAAQALAGEFGRAMKDADFGLTAQQLEGLSDNMKYARACLAVAERAPVIIRPWDRIVGEAPLLEATRHQVPLLDMWSISHVTIDFAGALQEGYDAIRSRVLQARDQGRQREPDLYEAMLLCLDAADIWRQRYVAQLQRMVAESDASQREHWSQVLQAVQSVPNGPPATFHQAVQSLWLLFCFQRLMGNWSGIGRIDQMLGPYLQADLQAGRIDLDQARELLAHFWIKGASWTGVPSWESGDAQFYQNIVLAGVDADGVEITNEVTYLVLDIVEELHISDFPVAVRVSNRTDERLWRRIAEVQKRGGGIVAIYNEELVLEALQRMGLPQADARAFSNDGCWEVIVQGKSSFAYHPFDLMRILQNTLGLGPDEVFEPDYQSFDDLYAAFHQRLAKHIASLHDGIDRALTRFQPSPLLSLLVRGCIENGRSYGAGGAIYNIRSPHAGGLPDAANSLLTLNRLVYEQGRYTLGELLAMVRVDWQGYESDRLQIRRDAILYGNDDPAADAMVGRVFDDYTGEVNKVPLRAGILRPPGISTFGREAADFLPHRTATVFGYRKGEYLSTNMAPTPGTDRRGPTAVIASYCRMDYLRLPNGTPLELKLHPGSLQGESGTLALTALLKTFVLSGGWFLQVDVVDAEVLRQAQAHPERFPNLCVRISGWSARFHTLSKPWQDLVIQRTQQQL